MSTGGAFAKIEAGSVGSAAKNASYITRESAQDGDLVYHNAPEDVEQAETHEETRVRLRSWADLVEAEEKARHGNRTGQPRTHYRAVLSYEDEIGTEQARADAEEWLEEAFPEAEAVAAVHQDTDHTHVHIWMSARKMDGSKVHISNSDLKEINRSWDQVYERRMQKPGRIAEKMEETRQFKRRYAELREQGASPAELKEWAEAHRPERATPPGPSVYRQRDRRPAVDDLAQLDDKIEEKEVQALSKVAERARQHINQRDHERHEGRSERAEREVGEGRAEARPGKQEASRPGEGQPREIDRGGDPGSGGGSRQDESSRKSGGEGQREGRERGGGRAR